MAYAIHDEDFSSAIPDIERKLLERAEISVSRSGIERFFFPSYTKATRIIALSHGFTENITKYYEIINAFLIKGYHVAFISHRGHGGSALCSSIDSERIHIRSFSDYIRDFSSYIRFAHCHDTGIPISILAHSMGGCIALRYLETHPESPVESAVLSSPMLKLLTSPVPELTCLHVAEMMTRTGKGEEYLAGQGPYRKGSFAKSGSTSLPRFDFYNTRKEEVKAFQKGGCTNQWTVSAIRAARKARKESYKVTKPVLLLYSDNDTYVDTSVYADTIKGMMDGHACLLRGRKHELFSAPYPELEEYLSLIFGFLDGGFNG